MVLDSQYTKGDATSPSEEGNEIITHLCNDVGGWVRLRAGYIQ